MATIPPSLVDALAGRYHLERELGAGGMATVYLALDERHGRNVAVKVLRPELAASVGKERFLREIAIAAQLQHPHVLPLHDSGEAAGFLFYVMPYVDGPSLRQKLVREGELPIADAIRILRDVAEALAHAHSRGVVHRDIKPENVMLSGRHALVADFGVAKALEHATGRVSMTSTGIALGTPSYMSPEQVAADPHTDHRADIYAFGTVAYELLAGRPPFLAPTPQAMLAMQLTEQPEPLSARRASVPQPLAAMVMQCLAKRPADRVQSADELVQGLEALLTPPAGMTPAGTAPQQYATAAGAVASSPISHRYRYAALAALVLAVAAAAALLGKREPNAGALARVTPMQVTYDGGVYRADLSPDGQLLAYCSTAEDSSYVSVQDLGGGAPIRITGTGLTSEFCSTRWSPDGASLLVQGSDSTRSRLMVFPRLGGAARHTITAGGWVAWSPDSRRIAVWGAPSHRPVRIVELATGREQNATIPDSVGFRHAGDWSPSGEHLVFSARRPGTPDRNAIHTLRLEDGRLSTLLEDSVQAPLWPRWASDGKQIYYVRGGDVWTLGVRPDGRARGRPRLLRSGLRASAVAVSDDAQRVAYTVDHSDSNLRIVKPAAVRGGGEAEIELTRGSAWHAGAASPDGSTIAYAALTEQGGDLYLVSAAGGKPRQLTSHHEARSAPAWSPDGSRLAYIANTQGVARLRVLRLGDGTERTFDATSPGHSGPAWAPGERILYQRAGNRNYHFVDPASGAAEPLVTNDSVGWMFGPRYSPDGRYVSVAWNRERPGVWLIDLQSGAQRLLPSPPWGDAIGWSKDGRWVYMLDLRTKESYMVAADGSNERRPFEIPGLKRYEGCEAFHADGGLSFLCDVSRSTSDVWLLDLRAGSTK